MLSRMPDTCDDVVICITDTQEVINIGVMNLLQDLD